MRLKCATFEELIMSYLCLPVLTFVIIWETNLEFKTYILWYGNISLTIVNFCLWWLCNLFKFTSIYRKNTQNLGISFDVRTCNLVICEVERCKWHVLMQELYLYCITKYNINLTRHYEIIQVHQSVSHKEIYPISSESNCDTFIELTMTYLCLPLLTCAN